MIATRFWLGILGLALAFAMLVGQLAVSMHDRLGMHMVSEGLAADSIGPDLDLTALARGVSRYPRQPEPAGVVRWGDP